MLISLIRSRSLQIALAAMACLVLAAPSLAGTVYSWQTEDGTHSFTDNKKQVPARYRDQAVARQAGKLRAYPRLTPTPKSAKGAYADRLRARLAELRGEPSPQIAPAAAAPGTPMAVALGGSRRGGNAAIVPVGVADESEPVVIERHRVRPADSLATRHITVLRQGERKLLVSKNERSQRSYMGADFPAPRESDFE